MKAIVYHQYGSPEQLTLQSIPKPTPKAGEVLLRVHAASVNSWDWDLVRGKPWLVRMGGWRKPAHPVLGADVAGVVEAVGGMVTRFKPGDAVFGDLSGANWGGFAEWVCAPEKYLAAIPKKMSMLDAAAIPQAGVIALQGLEYNGGIQPGQRVLLNGAGGGVGTIALQLAKSWGAEVTAVDHGSKLGRLQDLGADQVLDYTKTNYTKTGQQYDLVLDVVAWNRINDYKRVLRPGGAFSMVGGNFGLILPLLIRGGWISRTSNYKIGILAHIPNSQDLERLSDFYQAQLFRPIIHRIYSLEEVPQAIADIGAGRVFGKALIQLPVDSE